MKTHEHWEIIRAKVTNSGGKDLLYVDPIGGGIVSIAPGETIEANVKVNYPRRSHLRSP